MGADKKVWIWTVTQKNWDAVRNKKAWAVDVVTKSKKVSKGDTIVFYVSGTGFFRGAFRTTSHWHAAIGEWPDGKMALEIDLEEVETGYASVKKLAPALKFVTNPSKIGSVLMGIKYGPSNFGRSITGQDCEAIMDQLRKTKSPEAVGRQIKNIDAPEDYDSRLADSPIRLHLIKSLFENLRGPKNGPSEEIENVLNAYVVGILRTGFNKPDANTGTDPSYTAALNDVDTDASVTPDGAEDKESPDYDLNPMFEARSIGLSFVVSGKKPSVRICFTWGRYEHSKVSKKIFRRQMNFFITQADLKRPQQEFKPEDHPSADKRITKKGAEISVISTKISEKDKYHVSIFLVNNTPYAGGSQSATDRMFQPQIRVKCMEGTTLQELDLMQDDAVAEDAMHDSVIYKKRRNMGRGHFCGTVWHEVDPEDYGKEGFSTFSWPDSKSKHFPDEFSKEFTRPDIRTEFFPTYSILQPEIDDKDRKFAAEDLSDTWNPEDLELRLGGIVKSYGDWIQSQEKLGRAQDDAASRQAARSNLENCTAAKDRIRGGIEFLKSNERARLAFCFMNKAISLKSKWEGASDFSWWEFQMAFILQCLRGVAQQDESERDLCDILWFPTGGGKTEAYLGLTIFTIIFFRLQRFDRYSTDGGVSVISRYTLRLLTIQQFQRAVVAITAADYLRVTRWLPNGIRVSAEELQEKISAGKVWGGRRISIGLLIGGSATPNKFRGEAELILSESSRMRSRGEPSQVLNCPCCQTILAAPASNKIGLDENAKTMHWIFSSPHSLQDLQKIPHKLFGGSGFVVVQGDVGIKQIGNMTGSGGAKFYGVRISFKKSRQSTIINGEQIKQWWNQHVADALSNNTGLRPKIASTSPERPGYFFAKENNARYDFAIYCPNPDCQLNAEQVWFESTSDGPRPPVPKPFKIEDDSSRSLFMPIPAFTLDEQIFRRCPSMIISTVDKFAMLPFMDDFASVFGNVDQYDNVKGYGRHGVTAYSDGDQYDSDICRMEKPFLPPSLVIQDELHLIEGPLGSMVGAYEIAFDILSTRSEFRPKYIASSATIKEARSQVGVVYRKESFIFPPQGISIEDNYFSKNLEDRESKSRRSGRLYLGVCAPKKVLILPVRIWATLLSEVYRIRKNPEHYGIHDADAVDDMIDPYWTLVGYYNAIKELQISRSLYEDDIRRDVRSLSCQEIHSVDYQKDPLAFQPGLRFFPVLVDKEIDITTVVLHCNNSKGRAAVAVFDNSVDNVPGSMAMGTKAECRSKICSKGANEFELESTLHAKAGDVLWISVANDKKSTKFELGQSQMRPLFADMPYTHLEDIFGKYEFPANPVLNNEKETMRISLISRPRDLGPDPVELTGHTESQELPNVLKMLNKKPGNEVDAVFTTAVFGTGIDIKRLGLMVVMGQPKTTSAYIQATGRVGRNNPGLVITWHRAANVRDLNHYENFVGYHRMLQRFVEPISASPFSEESLRLCLGPVLVSILRNSSEVSKAWIDNKAGPMRMMKWNQGSGSVGDELSKIHSKIMERLLDHNIPSTRRPTEEQAKIRIDNAMSGWEKDARNLSSDRKELQYLEWTMQDPPKNNVVLGTPQHDIEKKTSVFKNVRTSMREVESTANFGYDKYADGRQIRPSQFVTTYGPGSLLRIGQLQMMMPSFQHMVQDLLKIEQFRKPDENEKWGLDKFQIPDKKIEKIINGILEKNGMRDNSGRINIFKLPSNADLSLPSGSILYTTEIFPRWAICKRHNILKKLEFDKKWILPCSICRAENRSFDEGVGIRFIQACPRGHMGDVNWQREVHGSSKCEGDEYDWDEEGNNFEVTCRTCNAKTTYGGIRSKSENNHLECSGQWAETGHNDHLPCNENADGEMIGTAKLVLKNASNLRITHVVSSLVIPPFTDRLYNMLSGHGLTMLEFANGDFTKEDVIQKFRTNREYLQDVNSEFLHVLDEKSEDEIKKAVRIVLEELKSGTITEQQSEDSEFEQLLQASKQGYPKPITGEPADFAVDVNKVRTSHSQELGIDLLIAPVDILHVVKVQVGYRREVKTRSEHEMDPYMISTTGNLVPTFYEERNGTSSTKWFVGKKIRGEGIFIHAKDPHFNSEIANMRGSSKQWMAVNSKQDDELLQRYTHPVFVWWHSFAHRLVTDLSIDSGFQSAAIAEKTYFRKNPETGKIEAGILLYAVQEGGDGTLGGLTGLVPSFGRIIERAIRRLGHCSNDPLCRERKCGPNRANGSACHACMLVSETSCGLQNRFLDRNLLLESL